MRFESELAYRSEKIAVVQVSVWEDDSCLGSTLGEGSTAEIAENRALERISERIKDHNHSANIKSNISNNSTTAILDSKLDKNKAPINDINANVPPPKSYPKDNSSHSKLNLSEPDDWSTVLSSVDMEIKRIGWSRENEIKYLKKFFGITNRNRITRYTSIILLIQKLKILEAGQSIEQIISDLNRTSLIDQGDNILRKLSWDSRQARSFLQNILEVSSRTDLSDDNLLIFNTRLEEELLKTTLHENE